MEKKEQEIDPIFSSADSAEDQNETYMGEQVEVVYSNPSNDSSESEYSEESDSDVSSYVDYDDDITGYEEVLQMGCMDVFFLPKKKPKKSLIKVNKRGKKELNLKYKGPLAVDFETRMRRMEAEKETELKSLMSLSHGSSEDSECDTSVLRGNLGFPPGLNPDQMQMQMYQQYANLHNQQHSQLQQQHGGSVFSEYQIPLPKAQYSYDMIMNNSSHGKPLQSSTPAFSMPSQILVEEQGAYDDDSLFPFDMAPDPPSTSLSRIVEDDYSGASSDEESDSSMAARGSIVSASQDDANMYSSKKESKLERWRKANNQRMRKKSTSSINEETNEDENSVHSVNSDEATYNSDEIVLPLQNLQLNKKDFDGKVSKFSEENSSSRTDVDVKPAMKEKSPKKEPEGRQSLAFDSIFSNRIEKRRAMKLKRIDPEENSTGILTPRKKNDVVEHRAATNPNSNKPANTLDLEIRRLLPSPKAYSVMEAVAAAAASALDEDFQPAEYFSFDKEDTENQQPVEYSSFDKEDTENQQPVEYSSFDKEDTENQAPMPIMTKGKDPNSALSITKKGPDVNRKKDVPETPKNPFQDEDILDEDDEIYEDEADAYPLLTKSSSDDADDFQPMMVQTDFHRSTSLSFHSARVVSSPFASRIRTVPMTPSPRA